MVRTYNVNILNHNFDFRVGAVHLLELQGVDLKDQDFIGKVVFNITMFNEDAELTYAPVETISTGKTVILDAALRSIDYLGTTKEIEDERYKV